MNLKPSGHLHRKVVEAVVEELEKDTYEAKRLQRGWDKVLVRGPKADETMDALSSAQEVICFSGARGSGKSTTLALLRHEIDQGKWGRDGRPAGYVLLDCNDLPESLLHYDPPQMQDDNPPYFEPGPVKGIETAFQEELWKRHINDRLSHLHAWLRNELAELGEGNSKENQSTGLSLSPAMAYKIDQAFQQVLGYPNSLKPEERKRVLLDEEGEPISNALIELARSLKTQDLVRFIMADGGFASFIIMLDNCDTVPNHLQPVYLSRLQDIHVKLGLHPVTSIVAIREENAPLQYGREANMQAMHIQHLKIDTEALLDDQGRGATEPTHALARMIFSPDLVPKHTEALKRRLKVTRGRVMANIGESAEDDLRVVETLLHECVRPGSDDESYLRGQAFDICNHSMRIFLKAMANFLRYVTRERDFQQLNGLAGLEPVQRQREVTSLFYRWLLHVGEEKPDGTDNRNWLGIRLYSLPNLLLSRNRPPIPNPANPCFPEHVVLSYLNRAQAQGHCIQFLEMVNVLKLIGFKRPDIEGATLHLYSDNKTDGHMLEIRRCLTGKRDGDLMHDKDEIWITPRGIQCVANIPYKFHFLVEGIHKESKGRTKWPAEFNIKETSGLVVSFARELANFHLEGLNRIRGRIGQTAQVNGRWDMFYRTTLGVPDVPGTRKQGALQVEILRAQVCGYLEQLGLDGHVQFLSEMTSEFTNRVLKLEEGEKPDPLPEVPREVAPIQFFEYINR